MLSACDPEITERSFNWLTTVVLFSFRNAICSFNFWICASARDFCLPASALRSSQPLRSDLKPLLVESSELYLPCKSLYCLLLTQDNNKIGIITAISLFSFIIKVLRATNEVKSVKVGQAQQFWKKKK